MLRLAANICGWFAVSIFLTLYNKLSVTAWGLDFPLTITCVHLLLRMPMAMVTMRYLGVRAARFSRRELLVSVFPVSVMIALDIGLSNMAFLFFAFTDLGKCWMVAAGGFLMRTMTNKSCIQ